MAPLSEPSTGHAPLHSDRIDGDGGPGRLQLTRRILVGVVGAPHGIRGEVRLKSFTEHPAAIAAYGPLRSEDGRHHLSLRAVRPIKDDMLVARFEGISTREAAAALTGVRLTLERAVLPAAAEDEFYHADLIGLAADAEDGTALGRVVAVVNHGAGDILEIGRGDGGTLLIAFTKAFVPVVDLAAQRLVVAAAALVADDEESVPPDAVERR